MHCKFEEPESKTNSNTLDKYNEAGAISQGLPFVQVRFYFMSKKIP